MNNTQPVSLTCPKCGKRYRVAASVVQRQKTARCSQCTTVFMVTADPQPPTPADEDQILAWLRGDIERED